MVKAVACAVAGKARLLRDSFNRWALLALLTKLDAHPPLPDPPNFFLIVYLANFQSSCTVCDH